MKIHALEPRRIDPSRTITLRKAFWGKLFNGYKSIKSRIKKEVIENDAFGLDPNKNKQVEFAFNEYWAHLTTDAQIESFMTWLTGVVDDDLMQVDWHKKLIQDAYTKGVSRAYDDTNAGKTATQDPMFSAGGKAGFLAQAFNQPETLSKVSVLFGQSYEALKGVNAAMAADMRRVLAEQLIKGASVDKVSKALFDSVDGITQRRARLIAQTEIIRAHAEGQLDSFEKLGVETLGALVEWGTARDDRVCPLCQSLQGKKFTVKEARGKIPLHPGCRCTWIPVVPDSLKQ